MSKQVYNLIFPNNCKQLQICGYVFTRIPEYDKNVQSLQHLVPLFSESNYIINTGTHAVTAYLDLPLKEEKSIINWDNKKTTALEDILLLLSIFTHRDVFVMSEPIEKGKAAITADPRIHYFGLGYSGELQKGIEKAYIKMQTTLWKKQYGDGVFLSLFRSACRRQLLESSFFICFTIWEKLFTLHNQPKLSDNQIKNTYTSKKISDILTKYQIKKTHNTKYKKGIKNLKETRNMLIHGGKFINEEAEYDALLFIRVTETIIAQVLGFSASDVDVFDARVQFLARLKNQKVPHRWEMTPTLFK